MNRRKFLTGMGMGVAALALAPKLALGQEAQEAQIVRKEDPHAGMIRILKNGLQVGVVYWANLETKQYRRAAIVSDFWPEGSWDGGRLVRHSEQSNQVTVSFKNRAHYMDGVGEVGPGVSVYPIKHLPIVDYPSWSGPLSNNEVVCALSVEGTFDEAVWGCEPSAEMRARYPGLKVDTKNLVKA